MKRRGMCLAGLALVGLLVIAGILVQAPVAASAWAPGVLESQSQPATAGGTQPARGGTVVAILPTVTYTVFMPFGTFLLGRSTIPLHATVTDTILRPYTC